MKYRDLAQRVEALRSRLTPAFVEDAVRTLLRGGEDVGGGVNSRVNLTASSNVRSAVDLERENVYI